MCGIRIRQSTSQVDCRTKERRFGVRTEQSGPLPNLLTRQSPICQNEQDKSPTPALQVQCPPVTMAALKIKCPSSSSSNGQDKSQTPALPVTLPSPVLELSTKPSLSIADVQPDMDWECGSVGSPARPSKLDAHKEQIQSCFSNGVGGRGPVVYSV